MQEDRKFYNPNKLVDVSKEIAIKFRNIINDTNYRFVYNSVVGAIVNIENWIDETKINKIISNIPYKEKLLVKTLLLGEDIDYNEATKLFGNEGIEFLERTNMFSACGENLICNGYILLPVNELYLIVSLPSNYKHAKSRFSDIYIGQDSMRLQQMLSNRTFDSVLDLCSGSGVQGLHYGRYANSICAVELNNNALTAASLNAKLNGYDNYKIFHGDLYSALTEITQFDCIISNPPYVPVPKDIEVAMCGDGGEDGMDIAKKIIDGYPTYLRQGGIGYMVLECIGDEEKPFILDYYQQVLQRGEINVSIISKSTLLSQADASARLICGEDSESYPLYLKKWLSVFKKLGATSIYSVVIEYKKNSVDWTENIVRNYYKFPFNKSIEFLSGVSVKSAIKEYFDIYHDGFKVFSVRKDLFERIEHYRGKQVLDILDEDFEQDKDSVNQINEMMNTIDVFASYGLLV